VRQKTFIEVDERGTRAAAATAVGVGITSFSGFVVDRPFAFAIRERLSGTILFVGLVGDPTAADPGPESPSSDCA
jgi:serpin B